MVVPEVFKYNTLISIPLFAIIAFSIVRKIPDFSFKKHTISKSVYFFNNPLQGLLFRFNFLLKSVLDFGFALYVFSHFNISLVSPIAILVLLSAVLFAFLSYFVEGIFSVMHNIIAYTSGTLWFMGFLFISKLIGNNTFFIISLILLSVPTILAFIFLFAKKTNVFIQILCMGIWYIWLLLFVFRYL